MHHNDFGTENDRNNVLGHQKWSAWLITPGRCYPLEVVRGWPWLAGEKMPPFHPLVCANLAVPSCNTGFLVAAPALVLVTLHAHGLRMITVCQFENQNCQP